MRVAAFHRRTFLIPLLLILGWRRALVFYFGNNPGDSAALYSAITALKGRTVEENYNSALTLGLALQAYYLVEIKDKIGIYHWVVNAISDAKNEFLAAGDEGLKSPITRLFLIICSVGTQLHSPSYRARRGRF